MLTLNIKEQNIIVSNPQRFVKGTVGAKCKVIFDPYWKDYNRTIVFKPSAKFRGGPITVYVPDMTAELTIPWEVMNQVGSFKIGAYGTTDVLTTPTLWCENIEVVDGTDTTGTAPKDPSPGVYNQLIDIANKAVSVAQSVRDDADAGKFNGGGQVLDEDKLVGKKTADGGEIFNDYVNNKALSKYSKASGQNNIAGVKVFYISSWDASANTYTLDSVEGLEVDDVVSIKWGGSYINFGKITAINTVNLTITTDKFAINDVGDPNTTLGVLFVVDKPTIGLHSFDDGQHVEGTNNVALLWGAHAEGYGNVSADRYAHTEGIGNIAYYAAHAEGYKTAATGKGSHAEGYNTKASSFYSHAEGYSTEAIGKQSHAEGVYTHATGDYSHAEGDYTHATGAHSHAEGYYTHACGTTSHAEGYGTKAEGENSHAEGSNTTASGQYSHSEGYDTHATGFYSHAEGYGTIAKAKYAHAEGYSTTASGESSHAEGANTNANGDASHTEGNNTTASGNATHAEGYNSHAKGIAAHAEGSGTTAEGDYSHAEGYKTTASGKGAHAEGTNTNASGEGSHAEGYNTTIGKATTDANGKITYSGGKYAHAEGDSTTASGNRSHAEGYYTNAIGDNSHAEGRSTTAIGNQSHAGGRYTIAGYGDQTVIGKFNNNKEDTLFEVGCGASEGQRENCFEAGKNQNGKFIRIGNTQITEDQLKQLLTLVGGTA